MSSTPGDRPAEPCRIAGGPRGRGVTDAYPATWEADVVLRDGHTVRVRPIQPDDIERLSHFHERQSPESVYFRFFSPRPVLSERELTYFTHIDYHDRVAFVGLLEDEIVGVARYERYKDTDTAEVAFFVDDEHNGRGLATVLLEFLAAAGRHRGLRRFTASTLPSNRRMLAVFSSAGLKVSSHLEDGVIYVTFDIHPTDESVRLSEDRRRAAEAASVQRLLRPASVAVIGLHEESGLGAEVLQSMVEHCYRGELVAVSGPRPPAGGSEPQAVPGGVADPAGATVPGGVAVVDDVPEATDLAVIAVAAADVPDVVEACGARAVGAVVILSTGFAETGLDGAALQWEVVEAARRHGIRVLGPNCLGLVNTDPEVSLHATIARGTPPAGRIGMLAESGTLAAAIIDHAERSQLGMSTFVAAGNPADISAADLLSYWADDEHTAAVLLYLRSSRLPSRLVRATRAASLAKPVAVLGNVLVAGGSADANLIERRVEALTRQTGVISVGTLEQLFDIGRLLSDQPPPAGSGVAVVGNSDGAVAIAADASRGAGLTVVDLAGDDADGDLSAPPRHNPVDLGYAATAEDYAEALAAVADHPGVHSVIVVHAPPRRDPTDRVVQAIVAASAAHPDVTFAATMLGAAGTPRLGDDSSPAGAHVDPAAVGAAPATPAPAGAVAAGHGVPIFRFPEHAARAIGRLAAYRAWRSNALVHGMPDTVGSHHDDALDVVSAALARGEEGATVTLDLDEQERLLGAYSVQVAPREVVDGPDAAVAAAERIGWPVALKAATRDRSTRSAASGVAIDVALPAQLRANWRRMEEALGEGMHPVVVQRFIERGVDASVVVRRDEGDSVTVEVGLGGPVTAFDEPQLGILPITLADAQSLVTNSALGRALTDPLDRVALVGVVHRLAAMMEDIEEIVALEADPIVASVEGAWVADVHIEVSSTGDRLVVRRLD